MGSQDTVCQVVARVTNATSGPTPAPSEVATLHWCVTMGLVRLDDSHNVASGNLSAFLVCLPSLSAGMLCMLCMLCT
jgi:hypothetical protein